MEEGSRPAGGRPGVGGPAVPGRTARRDRPGRSHTCRMFLRYYVDLALPLVEAEPALLEGPETWIPGRFRDAEGRGHALLTEVGFAVDERRIDREVEIELGTAYLLGSATRIPLT